MEASLGQTRDARALIPGDPAALRAHASSLTRQGESLRRVGDGLNNLDSLENWSGPAAEAFRTAFEPHPAQWRSGGDSHHTAAAAVLRYADTLEWAQSQASSAVEQWERAQEATDAELARYHEAAAQGEQQEPFVDPGAAGRENAQALLGRARVQLASAGDAQAQAITAAAAAAPRQSLLSGVVDDLESGVADALAGSVNGVASWVNAAVHNPGALAQAAEGTALAVGGGLVVGASGILDADVITAPAGLAAGAGGIAAALGGVDLAGHGLSTIAEHASSDDQVSVVGGGALTMPFAKKQSLPKLSKEEQEALKAKAEGKPVDPKLVKSAEKKVVTGQKFEGERNVQKREEDKGGKKNK